MNDYKEKQILASDLFSSGGFLVTNKRLLTLFGPSKATFLSNLVNKFIYFKENNMLNEDGSFITTFKDQSSQTGMNEYELRKCKKFAKGKGFLSTYMKGLPSKEHYILNIDKIVNEI